VRWHAGAREFTESFYVTRFSCYLLLHQVVAFSMAHYVTASAELPDRTRRRQRSSKYFDDTVMTPICSSNGSIHYQRWNRKPLIKP